MKNYRKLLGSLLGSVTAGAVVAVAAAFGLVLAAPVAAAVVVILSAVGTYLAPPNDPIL